MSQLNPRLQARSIQRRAVVLTGMGVQGEEGKGLGLHHVDFLGAMGPPSGNVSQAVWMAVER